MTYKHRHICINFTNPIKGSACYMVEIRSEQEWLEEDGSHTIEEAWEEMPYEEHPRKGTKVGGLSFAIYGWLRPFPKKPAPRSGAHLEERLVGRYKSLRAALETLRDMGMIKQANVGAEMERYT